MNVDFLYSGIFRYGIRVDPEQWLIVLTGRHEGGADHPSVILLMCTYRLFLFINPLYTFDVSVYAGYCYHYLLPYEIRVSEVRYITTFRKHIVSTGNVFYCVVVSVTTNEEIKVDCTLQF